MMRSAVLAITNRSVARKMVTDTRAGRALAGRFVAGDTLESAIEVSTRLNEKGMTVSLDHLGEHVAAIEEAEVAATSYLDCIAAIDAASVDANISIKLTQLGMGLDDDVAAKNLDRLASAAAAVGTTVTVDMEESDFTDRTIDLYAAAQQQYGNLGIALQAALRRTPADLERLAELGGHIRLCKGAYAEPDAIAHQPGKAVDTAFDQLAGSLMQAEGTKAAIASHDMARIDHAKGFADGRGAYWEYQMLYGVRRDVQERLVAEGHNLRIYVPFGEAWYPYLTRRLAERPANMMFFARAMVGG